MIISDDKYIVFKTEEFNRAWKHRGVGPPPDGLPDAVVIRKGDLFAGPALQTYASNMALVVKLLRAHGLDDEALNLQHIADYFHACAVDANEMGYKIPD